MLRENQKLNAAYAISSSCFSHRLMKNSDCRLLKKIQRRGARIYKDENGNLKAEFNFQLS